MTKEVNIEVQGAEEFQRKMEQVVADLRGMPFLWTMKKAVLMIQRRAKMNLHPWRGPGTGGIDTGMLRASITPAIEKRSNVVTGVVGSNLEYAPYMELGTRPHWVPAERISRWAERHGMEAGPVFVTGKPLKFLRRAIETEMPKIKDMFSKVVAQIVNK